MSDGRKFKPSSPKRHLGILARVCAMSVMERSEYCANRQQGLELRPLPLEI